MKIINKLFNPIFKDRIRGEVPRMVLFRQTSSSSAQSEITDLDNTRLPKGSPAYTGLRTEPYELYRLPMLGLKEPSE